MSDASPAAPTTPSQKPQLQPANQNPWYWLATLHGEQPEGAKPWKFDQDRHAKNRLAWNRFMAGQLTDDEIAWARALENADGSPRFFLQELTPYTGLENAELLARFRARAADPSAALPGGNIDFKETDFGGGLILQGYLFADYANFCSADFAGAADFHSTTFAEIADFERATFIDYVEFQKATFAHTAVFRGAIFASRTDFQSAAFAGYADFTSATFADHADFTNAKFLAVTVFAEAHFKTQPPIFHGASMHEATQWHGVIWPSIPQNKDAAQDHIYAYERLKQEMERLKKHGDEQFFFTREVQCREVIDGFPEKPALPALWPVRGLRRVAHPPPHIAFAHVVFRHELFCQWRYP